MRSRLGKRGLSLFLVQAPMNFGLRFSMKAAWPSL
jgi:hypothetical protein